MPLRTLCLSAPVGRCCMASPLEYTVVYKTDEWTVFQNRASADILVRLKPPLIKHCSLTPRLGLLVVHLRHSNTELASHALGGTMTHYTSILVPYMLKKRGLSLTRSTLVFSPLRFVFHGFLFSGPMTFHASDVRSRKPGGFPRISATVRRSFAGVTFNI